MKISHSNKAHCKTKQEIQVIELYPNKAEEQKYSEEEVQIFDSLKKNYQDRIVLNDFSNKPRFYLEDSETLINLKRSNMLIRFFRWLLNV